MAPFSSIVQFNVNRFRSATCMAFHQPQKQNTDENDPHSTACDDASDQYFFTSRETCGSTGLGGGCRN